MEKWMVVVAVVIVLLPAVLMLGFQRADVLDSRGRRVDADWRVDRHKI